MAVDLRSNSLFNRTSVLIEPDCLVLLEHERTKDRVRKIMFDRVEQVIAWRKVPVIRILVVALFLLLPGAALFFVGNVTSTVIAIFLEIVALTALTWYLYCQKTIIRLVRSGKTDDITGVFRPGKVRRLLAKIESNIRNVQLPPISIAEPPAQDYQSR